MCASPGPIDPLAVIAWWLGGLSLNELWGRYVGLGGNRSVDQLADHLGGTATWPASERSVLAQALNEGLWDLGCPSLAPTPDDEPRGVGAEIELRDGP